MAALRTETIGYVKRLTTSCGATDSPVSEKASTNAASNDQLKIPCTYAEVGSGVFLLATAHAKRNQCIIELVERQGLHATLDSPGDSVCSPLSHSGDTFSRQPEAHSPTAPPAELLPPALKAAFRVPRVIQLLVEDEGVITTMELVVEEVVPSLRRSMDSDAQEIERQVRSPLSLSSSKNKVASKFAADSIHVHLFIGTSNGTVFVCNALRGTILVMAQFQYHHDWRGARSVGPRADPDEVPAVSDLEPYGETAAGAAKPSSPSRLGRNGNQSVVRFVVDYKTCAQQWNPSVPVNAKTGNPDARSAVAGVYVVHDGGKVVFIGRSALDVFISIATNRRDGQRPHFMLEWSPNSTSSSYPVAGPASSVASMIEFVYVLEKPTQYSDNEKLTCAHRKVEERCVRDAAYVQRVDTACMAQLLQKGPQLTETLVLCGTSPAFAIYPLEGGRSQFSATRAVKAVTSLVTGMAKSLWFGALGAGNHTEMPKRLEKKPQRASTAFLEGDSTFSAVAVDPTQQWMALYCDGAGRLYISEASEGTVWLVIKGSRAAQFQWWLTTVLGRAILLLVVHLPLRCVVEVYSASLRQRVAACHVPQGSTLLRTSNPRAEAGALLLTPQGTVVHLVIDVTSVEAEARQRMAACSSASDRARHRSAIDPGVLRACGSPDDFLDVAVQVALPRFSLSQPGDAARADFTAESFRTFKRQQASVCEALQRRFAPSAADMGVIPYQPNTLGVLPRDTTAAQCLHYIRLRSSAVDCYAKLMTCGARQDDPAAELGLPQVNAALLKVPLGFGCPRARSFWADAAQSMCALLAQHSAEAAMVKPVFLSIWRALTLQVTSLANAKDNRAADGSTLIKGEVVDLPTFLSWFYFGERKISFLRDKIQRAEDDDEAGGRDDFSDLADVMFGGEGRGLEILMRQLDTMGELGLESADVACAVLGWTARRCQDNAAHFCASTSLGYFCAVLQLFSDEAFQHALERVYIAMDVASANGGCRLHLYKKRLVGVLACAIARHHANGGTSSCMPRFMLAVRQLLHLLALPFDEESEATTTSSPSCVAASEQGDDGDDCDVREVGLRLQYLLPQGTSAAADTLEACLVLRYPSRFSIDLLQRRFNRIGAPQGLVDSHPQQLLYFLCIGGVVVPSRASSPNFSVPSTASYPWVREQTWRTHAFTTALLDPIESRWAEISLTGVPIDPVSPTSKKMSPEEQRTLFQQCALLVVSLSVLQQTVRAATIEALSFWKSGAVPDANFFACSEGGADGHFKLAGSRATRDYLQCVSRLGQLALAMLRSVYGCSDDRRRVLIIQAISGAVAEDDELALPIIPAALRARLKVFMQVLGQCPTMPLSRLRRIVSMTELLLFFIDTPAMHIEGQPLDRTRLLTVPWATLYGNPSTCVLPQSEDLSWLPSREEMAPGKRRTTSLEGNDKTDSMIEREDDMSAMRAASNLEREFLSQCVLANEVETENILTPAALARLQSADTRALLARLSSILDLTAEVKDFDALVLLDFGIRHVCSSALVERELLYISNRGLAARVAASNLQAFLGCSIEYMSTVKRRMVELRNRAALEKASSRLNSVLSLMSDACRQWVQAQGETSPVGTNCADMIGDAHWISQQQLNEVGKAVFYRLSLPADDPQRRSFIEILFTLAQLAVEGKAALPPDTKRIVHELPPLAHGFSTFL